MTINADRALESPQILIQWDYPEFPPDIDRIRIVRSPYRYPESVTDGIVVLDEVPDNTNLRTSFADITVAPMITYYYSAFFDYKGPFSATRAASQSISRLGELRSIYTRYVTTTQIIGTGSGSNAHFTGTLTHGLIDIFSVSVTANRLGVPMNAADDGSGNLNGDLAFPGSIDYFGGSVSLDFDYPVDTSAPVTVTYSYLVDSSWILSRDEKAEYVIWSYDYVQQLCDLRIALTGILSVGETVETIVQISDSMTQRFIELITNKRYVSLAISLTAESVSPANIIASWDLINRLDPGFLVVGACLERDYGPVINGIRIIDGYNEKAVLLNRTTGVEIRRANLSVLNLDTLRGCSYDTPSSSYMIGAGKYIYYLDTTITSPTTADLDTVPGFPVRSSLADFEQFTYGIFAIDSAHGLTDFYSPDADVSHMQLEEPEPVNGRLVFLWRFKEVTGNFLDVTTNALNGIPTSGIKRGYTSKYGSSILLGATDSVHVAVPFISTTLTMSTRWRQPYAGYLSAVSNGAVLSMITDANNYVELRFNAGVMTLTVDHLGTLTTGSAAIPAALSDDRYHTIAVSWSPDSFSSHRAYVFVDGIAVINFLISTTWSATTGSVYVGANTIHGALQGYYADALFTQVYTEPSMPTDYFARYDILSDPSHASSFGGQDPSVRTANLRDTFKLYLGRFILENDYGKTQLPVNKILPTTEVIFRQSKPSLVLGHVGSLSRLLGLMLDRVRDYREFFLNHLTVRSAEGEFLPQLGELIKAGTADEEWNVDAQRKFLEIMWWCYKLGGTAQSFVSMTRFLGTAVPTVTGLSLYGSGGIIPHVGTRIYLDSCVDPDREDVPFDSGTFDSSDYTLPLVKLYLKFFSLVSREVNGTTSLPATRHFVDSVFNVGSILSVGDMIEIHDPDNAALNDQYLITSVLNSTTVVVDKDWPAAASPNVKYEAYWRIPNPDPYTDMIITRFLSFKARWQELVKDPS